MKPENYPKTPAALWQHFHRISQIPRPSGHESQIRDYIIELADAQGYSHQVDAIGNLVVYVPATAGCEHAPCVAIQNHLDMVTVKTAETDHSFEHDPLTLIVEDDWLSAQGTTLGADNGIGVAAALAVLTETSLVHPALELLFTVEEETGLYGASGLDASGLKATRLVNLDTEDWGEIYIGCAGGYGYEASRQVMTKLPKPGLSAWQIHLKGLTGGHSGVQIHQQLANANKLLGETLLAAQDLDWQLVQFRGGVAHNVIAREASVVLMINEQELEQWQQLLTSLKTRWLSYLPAEDHNLEWLFNAVEVAEPMVLTAADTQAFLNLITLLPHGAQSYNLSQPADLVDLSCNMAVVNLQQGELSILTSLRYFNVEQTHALKQQIEAVFNTFHLGFKVILDYPGWNPDFNSQLVARTQTIAEQITAAPVALKAIHAGLECGILLSKKPDMDIVSFGPTIRGAHSPSERVQISTVAPFWQLLTLLLAELATD